MMWNVKITGDMTLSIVDEDEKQILKVDMLGANIMKAGTDGELLCRTINDLTVIANMSREIYSIDADDLPYPDEGLSPFPWKVVYDEKKSSITVRSAKKVIANRQYPASFAIETILEIFECLTKGIDILNGKKVTTR